MLQACDPKSIRGNRNISENEVAIADYQTFEYEMHGNSRANIIYEQKPDSKPYLRIETDENIFSLLDIKSDSTTLSIKVQNREKVSPTKLDIYTNSRGLTRMVIAGNVKTKLEGKVETPELCFELYGAGNLTSDSIISDVIISKIYGVSDVNLTGKASRIECYSAGTSTTNTENIHADSVICIGEGMGKFHVYAEKYLKADISGMGSVKYKGNPAVDKRISGIGKVSKTD